MNVLLYVMATGYDIDNAFSGIVINVFYMLIVIDAVITKVHRRKIEEGVSCLQCWKSIATLITMILK